MEADIVLMTKSRKFGNYCVAGIEVTSGKWIRLVSDDSSTHCAVPEEDLTYEDHSQAEILDVVRVKLNNPVPLHFQPENVEYDSEYYWSKLRVSSLDEVLQMIQQHHDPYVFHDTEKRVPESVISNLASSNSYSLKLLYVDRATLHVRRYEKLRHSLSFRYNGYYYNYLSVTDDDFIKPYEDVGDYELLNVGLVISLGELHKDECHYKLVAAIIK